MLLVLAVISFPRSITGLVVAYPQVKRRSRTAAAIEIFTFVLLMAFLTLGPSRSAVGLRSRRPRLRGALPADHVHPAQA